MSKDFASLGVRPEILSALQARSYETPTPIQAGSIPHLLDGADLLGIAQTGTGKTAAFSIPMLQILHEEDERPRPGRPRALVLAPTRELALQIKDACISYGSDLDLKTALVFGGVGQTPQVKALQQGVDILIATPGRLLDLMGQGHCKLGDVDILVLDEADRMLDMGFEPQIRKILSQIRPIKQTLMWSATWPKEVEALARDFLNGDPKGPCTVQVGAGLRTAHTITQVVEMCSDFEKRAKLNQLLEQVMRAKGKLIIFCQTKRNCNDLTSNLRREGWPALAIHGDKGQAERDWVMAEFRTGRAPVMIATDVAARGIDVKDISFVCNYDMPNVI